MKKRTVRKNTKRLIALGLALTISLPLIGTNSIDAKAVKTKEKASAGFSGYLSYDEAKERLSKLTAEQMAANAAQLNQVTAEEAKEEYQNLAIAKVDEFVNVRSGPGTTYNTLGRMYNGAVADIVETDGDWLKVVSGSLEGYIKSEYFIIGDDALDVIDEYIQRTATVNASVLNIRKEPNADSDKVGYLFNGEKVSVLELDDDWLKVKVSTGEEGFVSADYATVYEEFKYAKTNEEIEAEDKARREKLAKEQEAIRSQLKEDTSIVGSAVVYETNAELRTAIVDFALQYVGCPYVNGGQKLGATDCSGFTMLVYQQFGYSLSRLTQGQCNNNGRSITLSEAQPGDVICYSYGSSCSHVALYIGNGQIVHAANSRRGVVIDNVGIEPIIAVKNMID
ncbi:MAG: C40 family peptidase [Lachnospiraceae bacterium]|nr:C40 family peptidase [Lachnospiraceae bacterium]